jgi:hypothetical protein
VFLNEHPLEFEETNTKRKIEKTNIGRNVPHEYCLEEIMSTIRHACKNH